jgi:putative intracellular protease/amidase
MSTIVTVVTSHNGGGALGRPTGLWLEELAAPYYVLGDAGHDVVLASIAGGQPPIDEVSLTADASTALVRRFLADEQAQRRLQTTVPIGEALEEPDAVFLVGGHGTMWDFPGSDLLGGLIVRTADRGMVAAVCHGPAGLLAADPALFAGRTVTGFSDREEEIVNAADLVPFSLEEELVARGARYVAGAAFTPHAVRDGNLITGQNPASSTACAALLSDALAASRALAA